jgi:hypothetical protein
MAKFRVIRELSLSVTNFMFLSRKIALFEARAHPPTHQYLLLIIAAGHAPG